MLSPTGGTLNRQTLNFLWLGAAEFFIFTHDNFACVVIKPHKFTRLTSLVVVVLLMCTSLLVSVGR